MQIIRTIIWVPVLVPLLAFAIANWTPVSVKIWDGIVLETKIPALVIIAFLAGLVPMWLVHRGAKWRLGRRIATLESAIRSTAPAAPALAPAVADETPDGGETPPPTSTPTSEAS